MKVLGIFVNKDSFEGVSGVGIEISNPHCFVNIVKCTCLKGGFTLLYPLKVFSKLHLLSS